MKELIQDKLYVGATNDLESISDENWAVVHAAQTYHYKLFGWNKTTNIPNKSHPNYIIHNLDNHLSLNWVDGPAHLYKWSGPETFTEVLDFIEKWSSDRKVLVHCDQGASRSPTVVLLYLAKRVNKISNNSFDEARKDFQKLYPIYNPNGIAKYVSDNWNDII